MRITIDTREDTQEDIRKVLHILTHIIEKKEGSLGTERGLGLGSERSAGLSSEARETADTSNLMSMFANTSGKKEDAAPDFSSFTDLVDKKEDKEEKPRVQIF